MAPRHLINLNLRTFFQFENLFSVVVIVITIHLMNIFLVHIKFQFHNKSPPPHTQKKLTRLDAIFTLTLKYDFRDLWTIRKKLLRVFLIEMASIQDRIPEQARESSQKHHHMFQNVSHHVVRPRHLSQAPQQYVIQVCSSLFAILSKHLPFLRHFY